MHGYIFFWGAYEFFFVCNSTRVCTVQYSDAPKKNVSFCHFDERCWQCWWGFSWSSFDGYDCESIVRALHAVLLMCMLGCLDNVRICYYGAMGLVVEVEMGKDDGLHGRIARNCIVEVVGLLC